ncbi:hypothetical protein FBU30_010964 [Linnemannia zychae]|nr:hypothetical protein FBU30_010964 [Linnemannia zychae]
MDPAETIALPATITTATAAAKLVPVTSTTTLVRHTTRVDDAFPIRVAHLPNRGRSYIATRMIQPHELIFVAEAFGTTMCDPWLDCGICHYCWSEILDRKTQIRLPSLSHSGTDSSAKKGNRKKQEIVMVFCNETCWKKYGPNVADMICKVESKIRRAWTDSGAKHWKIKTEALVSKEKEHDVSRNDTSSPISKFSSTVTTAAPKTMQSIHYSDLIREALEIASTKQQILALNDDNLAHFLEVTWNALDSLIAEQESWIQPTSTSLLASSSTQRGLPSYNQAQLEVFYPKLARWLLERNDNATIATKTSDDDCEMIRLISEVLYRRQLDICAADVDVEKTDIQSVETVNGSELQEQSKAHTIVTLMEKKEDDKSLKDSIPLQNGQQATFEDYCAMQSNEVVLVRQQLSEELYSIENNSNDEQFLEEEKDTLSTQNTQRHHQQDHPHLSRTSKHDNDKKQWHQLLSILPEHLLNCFYVYLRIRDAYFLLAHENKNSTQHQPDITLTITHTLFRTILYREVANSFGIRDSSDELLGFAVFPRACFFNHSCRPNVLKKRRQSLQTRQMEYWSSSVILEGEECCISYGDISTGVEERRARLEDMYFFTCSCSRCIEEAAEK